MTRSPTLPAACLVIGIAVFIWSGIGPYDRATWWMEVAPALIAAPLLLVTYRRFRLTGLLYVLIALHAVILMVGGHFTYARVPLFDLFEGRNNYDKLGHFAQGFIPAMVIRELLIRTSSLRPGRWLFTIVLFCCLGISAIYELIEWAVAEIMEQGADEFLGSQGDVWDTQKDMMWAGIGAATALLSLSKLHNRFLSASGKAP